MDADGACATVTCSNGSCSGVVVPGTGLHLNNMLGEEDLNPHGFHRIPAGSRVPSMMSPTVVLRDGSPEMALGSAGSNRIRSAIVQTVAAVIDGGLDAQSAVDAPRLHVEDDLVDAEPGVDEAALRDLEAGELAAAALGRAQPLLRRGAGRGPRRRHGGAVRRRRSPPRRRGGHLRLRSRRWRPLVRPGHSSGTDFLPPVR